MIFAVLLEIIWTFHFPATNLDHVWPTCSDLMYMQAFTDHTSFYVALQTMCQTLKYGGHELSDILKEHFHSLFQQILMLQIH